MARRRRFQCTLSGLLIVASVAALWSVAGIRETPIDHAVFWISGIGVLGAAVVGEAVLVAAWPPLAAAPRGIAAVLSLASMGVAAIVCVGQLRAFSERSLRVEAEALTVRRLSDAVVARVRDQTGRPRVEIDQPVWQVATGVLLQLQKAGVSCTSPPARFTNR